MLTLPLGLGSLVGPGGPVVFDAKGTSFVGDGLTTQAINYTGITVGSGNNRALLALVSFANGSGFVSGVSATWDQGGTNQAMTLVSSKTFNDTSGFFITAMIFALRAPTSGNKTLHIAWTGAAGIAIDAVSFTGVNQSSDAAAFKNAANNSGAFAGTASVTVTGAVGDMAVALHVSPNEPVTSTNDTQIAIENTWTGSGANYAAGAASNTLTATLASNTTGWVSAGIDVASA